MVNRLVLLIGLLACYFAVVVKAVCPPEKPISCDNFSSYCIAAGTSCCSSMLGNTLTHCTSTSECCSGDEEIKCCDRGTTCQLRLNLLGLREPVCVADSCSVYLNIDSCLHKNTCSWCCTEKRCKKSGERCRYMEKSIMGKESCLSQCSYASTCAECVNTYKKYSCGWCSSSATCLPRVKFGEWCIGDVAVFDSHCKATFSVVPQSQRGHAYIVISLLMLGLLVLIYAIRKASGDLMDLSESDYEDEEPQLNIRKHGFDPIHRAQLGPLSNHYHVEKQFKDRVCDVCHLPFSTEGVVRREREENESEKNSQGLVLLPCKHFICFKCCGMSSSTICAFNNLSDISSRVSVAERSVVNTLQMKCPLCKEIIVDFIVAPNMVFT